MTIYAMSSIRAVAVSAAHGGCGQQHERPSEDGEPTRTWALDCPQCESFLQSDSAWSAELATIPRTYDETRLDEQAVEQASRDHGGLLTGMGELLSGYAQRRQAAVAGRFCTECGSGMPASARFCPGCSAAVVAADVPAELTAAEHEPQEVA